MLSWFDYVTKRTYFFVQCVTCCAVHITRKRGSLNRTPTGEAAGMTESLIEITDDVEIRRSIMDQSLQLLANKSLVLCVVTSRLLRARSTSVGVMCRVL